MKVVISGATKGIGNAIGKLYKEKGHEVINVDIENCLDFKTFIGSIEDEKLMEDISKEVGNVDLIVANAAIQDVLPLKKTTPSSFKKIIDVNLSGTYNFIYNLLPNIKDGGNIIVVSSVHGDLPRENKYAYDASKGGLNILTKELALSLAKRGIRVNGLLLGATLTPMNDALLQDKEKMDEAISKIPFGRIMEPSEVANAVYSLTSENFSYMTGSLITLDGGRSLK